MRSLVIAWVLVASTLAWAEEPEPSQPEPLRPGTFCSGMVAAHRVRVVTSGVEKRIVGDLVASDPTTLEVLHDGQMLSLPRKSVTRLERSARPSRRALGMKIGGGIGFALGAGLGIALIASERERTNGSCDQCGIAVGILGVLGAAPGALLGAVVAPGERWVAEDPGTVCVERRGAERPKGPRLRLGIAPGPAGGVGFGLSVSF